MSIEEIECLSELTDEQLKKLLVVLDAKIKDYRQKATKALAKHPELSKAWIQTLSVLPAGTTAEMAEQAREERRRAFEKRLVENPEAFVLYQTSYYLQRFQERVRAERVARAAK